MAHDKRIKLISQSNQGQAQQGRWPCLMRRGNIFGALIRRSHSTWRPDPLIGIVDKHDDVDVIVLTFAYEEEDGRLSIRRLCLIGWWGKSFSR
jgi:hypothetical protein